MAHSPLEVPSFGSLGSEGQEYVCDRCGVRLSGEPAGAGLFLTTRGDEVRYEEPPLCESCAKAIAAGVVRRRRAK